MYWEKLKQEAIEYGKRLEENPENLTTLALLAARFPRLSPLNLIALQLQCPTAKALRPAGDWMNEKIQIRVSQTIIHLYEQATATTFQRNEEILPLKKATSEEKYRMQTGKLPLKMSRTFLAHSFFDLTQTKLPLEKYPNYLSSPFAEIGDEKRWQSALLFAQEMAFKVQETQFSSPQIQSRYQEEGHKIELSGDLSFDKRTDALLHELATGILLRTSVEKTIPQIREMEAETLYAGLANAFGFEPSTCFQEHLRAICRTLDPEQVDINASFTRIKNAHAFTIGGMAEGLATLFGKDVEAGKKPIADKIRENFLQDL